MAERVLVIINTIDAGGAETFVMKVFRCIYKDYIFDFLINKKDSSFYWEEIKKLGGEVYYGTPKSQNLIKSMSFIYNTVRREKYKKVFLVAVHPIGFFDIIAARLAGANLCITRSTNSSAGGKISHILAKASRPFIALLSDKMIAPSKEAGNWLFGERLVKKGKVNIITNGLQPEIYKFDLEKRKKIRKEIGVKEKDFVIGHVGRFNKQKNHDKLIDIFVKLQDNNKNAKLVLVGDGELKEYIKRKVNKLGIKNEVIFLGVRSDIPEILMAMDVFVFPSLFEGMPNAVIEAQATGLPCVISDTISKDVKITDHLVQINLNSDSDEWLDAIMNTKNNMRKAAIDDIVSKGYSIECSAEYIANVLNNNISCDK